MGDPPPHLPPAFLSVATREASSGKTIRRCLSLTQLADPGTPFAAVTCHPDELAQAEDTNWRLSILADPWTLPAGAFGDTAGPV